MSTHHDYEKGMKVEIIAAFYKQNRTGTYLHPCGEKMACVKVDGDSQSERNLRLTSIHGVSSPKKPKSNGNCDYV